MCNNNLNTEGYDVDATDNGYRQIFQKLKGLNCYMIVQLKTIRENERTQEATMTQTKKERQNETPHGSVPPSEKDDDNDESDDN